MQTIHMLVGLQCSGKSTLAKELSEQYNATILNADSLREIYTEWNNEQIFNHLYSLMLSLSKDRNVILDNTNISIKNRKVLFNFLKQHNLQDKVQVVAHILCTPYERCVTRLLQRNLSSSRKVPIEALNRYFHSFQIPFIEEGFEDIVLYNENGEIKVENYVSSLDNINYYLENLKIDQDTKYHKHTVFEHSFLTFTNLTSYLSKDCDFMDMLKDKGAVVGSALLHDIGKLWTRTYKRFDTNAHYYNHENVGAYFLLTNMDLGLLSVNGDKYLDTIFYINYHMLPFGWETDKAKDKWLKIFGEEKFNNLLALHKADIESTGVNKKK